MYRGGYAGKILRVNLSDQSIKEEKLPEELVRDYLGGAGFGIKVLYDEVRPDTPPLSEANKLIFAVGPLTATGAPCASRMAVVAKSPLTGAIGMALSGGHFPAEMKRAGYDMIIIEGKAGEPAYLVIDKSGPRLRSAGRLAGMETTDTQLFVKEALGDQNYRVACIGPAGERQVPMACIINERRAAGRKGLGAVMGSKNLKAIAVLGDRKPDIADPEAFKEARSFMLKQMKESPVLYPEFAKAGTPMTLDRTTEMGIFSIRNWAQTGAVNTVPDLGKQAQDLFIITRNPCSDCPVSCSQVKLVTEGPYAGYLSEGPEFETTYSLGSCVGVNYLPAVVAADRLCDEYGIDSISAGVAIAWAMEAYEKGILTKKDTDGVDLKFGDHAVVMEMLRRIAFQDGDLATLLGKGTKKAAETVGHNSADFAMQVKGLEMPAYDIRGAKAHGLNYATAYTGADHNRGYAFQEIFDVPVPDKVDRNAVKGKGILTVWNQDIRAATCDCAPMCAFLMDMAVPAVACENTAGLVNGCAGSSFTPEAIRKIGARINNIAKLFNIGAGFTRKDDSFPKRVSEPIPAGPSKGFKISQEDLDEMLDEYYEERGWTREGIPTDAKLEELGIKKR